MVPRKRQTCTDHCAGCGSHFHGLGAFEAHRREQRCLIPEAALTAKGQPLLQVWTENGSCDKETGCWQDGKRVRYVEGVTIWQRYLSPEGLQRLEGWKSGAAAQGSLL